MDENVVLTASINNGENAVLKANIDGVEKELHPKTSGSNVYLDENTTLTPKIAEMVQALNSKAKETDLMDLKIKADGTTGKTPGIAVREQIRELKSSVEQIEQRGLSAVGVDKDFVPTANGDGSWEWKEQQGGNGSSEKALSRLDFGLGWIGYTNDLMLSKFNNDIESAAQAYAKHDFIDIQILNLNSYADSRPTLSEVSLKIIKRAKEINPRFRVFQYIQSESERYDFKHDGENAYLNPDGSWEGSTADLSGSTKIYNKQQIIDWLDYFAEIGTDGIFWDDWGYDSLLPICYQMGYDVSAYETKEQALNQKWIDLIELCHERGLAVITNGGFQTNVGDWYTHLDENDVVALESCLISSYGNGTWNNGQTVIYDIYKNYITTGRLKAKIWSQDYLPKDPNGTLLEKIQTYEIAMVLAAGGNYVSVGTYGFMEKPYFLESMTRGEGYAIKRVSDYIYNISNGNHTLEVYKSNVISGLVTESNIGKCYCTYDGHIFQNAYIEAPYLDADISARLGSIESTIGGITDDTRKNAQSYWRLAIDDWVSDLTFLDYTNYIRTKGSISTSGGNGSGTINGRFVENDIGGIDLVFEFTDCTGTRNPSVTCFSSTDEEDLGLIGSTLEFGFSEVEFSLDGYTGYNGNTDLSTSSNVLYEGYGYQWPDPGFSVYFSYTNKSDTFNPPSNTRSNVGFKNGFARQEAAIGTGVFSMNCWIASTTTYSGTITFKNIYCVNANEHDDEIAKKWYTNLYPTTINSSSAFDYQTSYTEIYGHDVVDVVATNTDAWGWNAYRFSGEEVIAMRGHTFEFGCMSMTLSNGETGKPMSNGANWAFGVGVDSYANNTPNPRTHRIYTDTLEKSLAWGENIPCVVFTVPDTAIDICIGIQSYGFPSETTMTANGVYLYDLGEDVSIRGQASTNASLRVCRVTEEQESISPAKVPNALFISDNGKMWCTKLDGSSIALNSVSSSDLQEVRNQIEELRNELIASIGDILGGAS